jgi:putative ABC transport system permease protein
MLPHDVRHALRMLRKAPGFTAAAVLTIALGIAANTAVFSVVNAAMIRALPFADPSRLMQVAERNEKLNLPFFSVSSLNYLSWKEQTRTFEDLGAFGFANYTLTGRGDPEEVSGNSISPSLVPLLGLRPLAGRTFRTDEDKPGNALVAMIGESLWQRRFGRDPAVVGRPLTVNGVAYTLVGVMGPELKLLTGGGELFVPMVIDPTRDNRLSHVINVIGRLRPGVTMTIAQAEMDAISRRVVEQYPDVRDWTIRIRSFDDYLVQDEVRTALKVLLGAVTLVLLIVCANVANLLLARAVGRKKEFAIRGALGASRVRLGRQLVTEGLALSLAGGALGLLLAVWAVRLLNVLPENQQPVAGIRIDTAVLLFTLAASVVTGVLFGVAPAWHGTRTDLNEALKHGARSSRSHLRPLLRNGQAGLQLALATVLVVGAGLLTQSLLRLQHVPVGFDAASVVTFRLTLPATKYPNHAKSWAFYKQMLESIARLPGVRGAAISSALPFGSGAYTRTPMSTPSRSVLPAGTQLPIDWRVVSPGFFRTLGIPLVLGRDFTEADSPQSTPVMVVSRGMARKYWGEDDPIGKIVHLVNARGRTVADYTVVGVVGDVRNISLNEELPTVYYSSSWRLWPSMEVAVRVQGVAGAILPMIRKEVHALDPDLPLAAVQTLEQTMSASASQPRFNAVLLLLFAGLALVVAGIGTYGVLAYSVSQRTHEIGMRVALGAERSTVVRLIVREGMIVGISGIAAGLLGAVALSRVVKSMLFGIDAQDPLTFVAAALALLAVALVACAAPAWRAARVDPIVALRAE